MIEYIYEALQQHAVLFGKECTREESWLSQTFNCGVDAAFRSAPDPMSMPEENVVFESSDEGNTEEYLQSSDAEGSVFQSSDGSVLCESDIAQEANRNALPAAKRTRYAPRKKDGYEFLGLPVCRASLARLIGVGNSTLERLRNGAEIFTNDARSKVPKHPMFGFAIRGLGQALWENVIMYLWFVYHRVAECMPTGFSIPGDKVQETPFPESNTNIDPDSVARLVNAFSMSLQSMSSDVDLSLVGPGTFRGSLRALPHQNRTDLYWDVVAASYTQFLRVANPVLGPGVRDGHLRFRKVNEHGQCDQCYHQKRAISSAKTPERRHAAQRDHRQHILLQWLDRQIYWSFRSMSQTMFSAMRYMGSLQALASFSVSQSVLTLIADGMDQAKYKCPRVRTRSSKTFEKLWRPKLHVGAVWVHGEVLSFFVQDEDTLKNSSNQIGMISRALDECLTSHGCLPHGLSVQCDNTCRESKNQFFMAWAAMQVALGVFRWCVANYLITGHSPLDDEVSVVLHGKVYCFLSHTTFFRVTVSGSVGAFQATKTLIKSFLSKRPSCPGTNSAIQQA